MNGADKEKVNIKKTVKERRKSGEKKEKKEKVVLKNEPERNWKDILRHWRSCCIKRFRFLSRDIRLLSTPLPLRLIPTGILGNIFTRQRAYRGKVRHSEISSRDFGADKKHEI